MSKAAFDVVRAGALAIGAYNQYRGRSSGNKTFVSGMGGGGGGTRVTRVVRRTGRKKRRTANQVFRDLVKQGERIVWRWQQSSRTYLGPGRVFLGMGTIDANLDRLPIHFLSLTGNNLGRNVPAKGAYNVHSMCRMYYNRTTGAFYWAGDVPSIDNAGNNAANVRWQTETATYSPLTDIKSCFHEWTDIRLNLYGTYSVPIHYNVMLCTMKEQVDPYQFAQGEAITEGSECANMLKDWTRSLMYESAGINSSQSTWRNDVRVVKQCRFTIQPLSYADQVAEQQVPVTYASASNIKELRWFIRHDRFRNYNWSRDATATTEARDFDKPGWDLVIDPELYADVEWGKRLFLVIQATCPGRQAGDPIYMTDGYANLNGSYDLTIRNAFSYQ